MKIEDITLDWLLSRVHEDDDGCLIWTESVNPHSGLPVMRWYESMKTVRSVVYLLIHGQMRKGKRTALSCGKKLCVHPDHVLAQNWNASLKGREIPIDTRIKIAMGQRKKSRLTDEQVQSIRSAIGTIREIGPEFGISYAHAAYIRRDEVRRDYSSPFAGLGA